MGKWRRNFLLIKLGSCYHLYVPADLQTFKQEIWQLNGELQIGFHVEAWKGYWPWKEGQLVLWHFLGVLHHSISLHLSCLLSLFAKLKKTSLPCSGVMKTERRRHLWKSYAIGKNIFHEKSAIRLTETHSFRWMRFWKLIEVQQLNNSD